MGSDRRRLDTVTGSELGRCITLQVPGAKRKSRQIQLGEKTWRERGECSDTVSKIGAADTAAKEDKIRVAAKETSAWRTR
jgi:hypothetical protein